MHDGNISYNDLPMLPPSAEVETAAVLKKAIADDLRAWKPVVNSIKLAKGMKNECHTTSGLPDVRPASHDRCPLSAGSWP